VPHTIKSLSLYPNPTNGNSTLSYTLAEPGQVSIGIYNSQGQLIKAFDQGIENSGEHQRMLPTESLPKGIYFVRIGTGSTKRSIRMVITNN